MSGANAQIRQAIYHYIDHLEDGGYVRNAFGLADVSTVVAILAEMLRSGDRQSVLAADIFLRDIVNYRMMPPFETYLPRSGLFRVLGDLLYVHDHTIRHNTIHTIGKIFYKTNVSMLIEALPVYLQHYPLELPDLFLELNWLSRSFRRRRWEHYEQAAASPNYLVRWSLLEILRQERSQPDERDPVAGRLEKIYGRLARDTRFLVGAEAEHALHLLRLSWEGQILPVSEYRRQKKRFREATPKLTFSIFQTRVRNYLYASGRHDYDLAVLERFARYCADHPFGRPFDNVAYARIFDEWRSRVG